MAAGSARGGRRAAAWSDDSRRTHQRPRQSQHRAFCERRSSFGSLAKFAAIRRASSRVSRLVAERSILRLAERVGELFGPACGGADGPIWVSGRAEQYRDRRLASRLDGVGRHLPGRRIKCIRERRDVSQCEIENDNPHRSIRVDSVFAVSSSCETYRVNISFDIRFRLGQHHLLIVPDQCAAARFSALDAQA
jgi:hypothetical protein